MRKQEDKIINPSSNENATEQTHVKKEHICQICKHDKRFEYEKSWLSRKLTLTEIAQQIGCSVPLVHRHMHHHLTNHSNMTDKNQCNNTINSTYLLSALQNQLVGCDQNIQKARDSENWQAEKAFMVERRHVICMIARLQGVQQTSEPLENAFDNPLILDVISAIMKTLEPYPDAQNACSAVLEEMNC